MGTADACVGCHDFDFPGREGVAMQSTGREHTASATSDRACQDCHMQAVDGPGAQSHKRHDFAVVSDPEMLRRAATIDVRREGDDALAITFRRGDIAHAFPTGDMFRRVEIHAGAIDDSGRWVEARPVTFARVFAKTSMPTSSTRDEIADTRLFRTAAETERTVVLTLPGDVSGRAISYRITHARMDDALAELFDVPDAQNRVTLWEGELGP
jgi:hypothetical protein